MTCYTVPNCAISPQCELSYMGSKLTSTRKWFAALHTPLCLFSRMSELVVHQTSGLIKCLIALITFIKVRSTAVGCHVVHKGCAVCLWTQVTRICLCHRKGLNQAQRVVNMYWRYNMGIKIVFCLHFPFHSWKEDNQANKQIKSMHMILFATKASAIPCRFFLWLLRPPKISNVFIFAFITKWNILKSNIQGTCPPPPFTDISPKKKFKKG